MWNNERRAKKNSSNFAEGTEKKKQNEDGLRSNGRAPVQASAKGKNVLSHMSEKI